MDDYKINNDFIPEENIFCSCCEEIDFTEQNQIVLCDGCDIAVHQECYHIINLEEKWYCQKCVSLVEDNSQKINCQFCPENYQILERVKINEQDLWVHSSCLKWNPSLNLVENSHNLFTTNSNYLTGYKCKYCQKTDGYQQQCQFQQCEEAFHIGCLKINGGLLCKSAMECLYNYLKPHLKIQDQKLLCCVEHAQEVFDGLEEKDKQIFQKQFFDIKNIRIDQYYKYNQNNKQVIQKSDTKVQRRQKSYEDMLFDEVIQLKELKQAKIPLKDKKIKSQFKEYMTKKLNDQLHKIKEDFLKKNHNNLKPEEDTYISIDIQLSKKLFDKVIDINDLEEFDKYLVSYFIFNNMIRKPSNPEIYIREESQGGFWKKLLDEIGIRNGEQFGKFLNTLRLKKMNLVSRNNEKLQYEQELQLQFENQNNELIE